MFQDLLLTAQHHVWFDREQGHERRRVQFLLKDHVQNGENEPMLVFPEGTCTNTQYCIMFKKGSFELGATVYPVAMRYRKEFGDAFWDSTHSSFLRHLFDLMTSWSVFCDVYYLEPQRMQSGESATHFASRVQELMCKRACLTKVNWNGFLKRRQISGRFLEQRQKAFAAVINRRINGYVPRAASARNLQNLNEMHMHEHELPSTSNEIDISGMWRRHGSLKKPREKSPDPAVARLGYRTARLAADAAHATVRWGIALALLTMITVISVRMTPASWRRLATEYARTRLSSRRLV